MGERAAERRRGPGLIPYRLWIGAVGHRTLSAETQLSGQVGRAIRRVKDLAPASSWTPVHLGVVSPLAEGADRLIARGVLQEPNSTLEAALPLPPADYEADFEAEGSREEFEELLRRAAIITTAPGTETRNQAYERAGRYVVDRAAILIAIWDGRSSRGKGGTAEIVEYAQESKVPVIWIRTEPPFDLSEDLGNGLATPSFAELDAYNADQRPSVVSPPHLRAGAESQVDGLMGEARDSGLGEEVVRPLARWMIPFMIRADALARGYQRLYFVLGNVLFLSAALAVTVVAAQHLFAPESNIIASAEVGLMLALFLVYLYGRRRRVHARWISYRALAERLRSALFTATAGIGLNRVASSERVAGGDPQEEWLRGAFEEVWIGRPPVDVPPSRTAELKRFLSSAWIVDQLEYHRDAHERNHRRERRLAAVMFVLFGLTLLAAILHTAGVGEPPRGEGTTVALPGETSEPNPFRLGNWIVFVSITLPAFAGAIGGIRAQREYVRNAERSRRMASNLEAVRLRLESAPDLAAVRAVARAAEAAMLEENKDWFGVMRFHDFELHV